MWNILTLLLLLLFSLMKDGAASSTCSVVETEVVIVGAGVAGLSAAKHLQENGVTNIKLLESTSRVGGRVQSIKDVFAPFTVERCAAWVSPGNIAFDLVQDAGIRFELNVINALTIYQYDATDDSKDPQNLDDIYQDAFFEFRKAFRCLLHSAANVFLPGNGKRPFLGNEAIRDVLIEECGWDPSTVPEAIDFFLHWIYLNFEYAEDYVSLADATDTVTPDIFLVADPEGFEAVPKLLAEGLQVEFHQRVTEIRYRETGQYPAKVVVYDDETGDCFEYNANYVISTLSVGVLSSGDVAFVPELDYPEIPYKYNQYEKIFYQFKDKFWDDTEFIVSLQEEDNKGLCHHWQNLDYSETKKNGKLIKEFLPESRILYCTITDEGMVELLGNDLNTKDLSDDVITGILLDPLRRVYGDVVDSELVKFHAAQLNTDANKGYGAFENWNPVPDENGDVFAPLYRYFGGDVPGVNVGRCEHNGCATVEDEEKWVLHLSGSASCYEEYGLVYGGIDSGIRSANYVLKEMGYDVDTESICEDFFSNNGNGNNDNGNNGKGNKNRRHAKNLRTPWW